jgi:hypothetical protein
VKSAATAEKAFTLSPEESSADPEDVNGDAAVDAVDVQLVINAVLGIPIAFNADVDGSGTTDAVDVQLVINGVLGV